MTIWSPPMGTERNPPADYPMHCVRDSGVSIVKGSNRVGRQSSINDREGGMPSPHIHTYRYANATRCWCGAEKEERHG